MSNTSNVTHEDETLQVKSLRGIDPARVTFIGTPTAVLIP